jgi:hypothetical protein
MDPPFCAAGQRTRQGMKSAMAAGVADKLWWSCATLARRPRDAVGPSTPRVITGAGLDSGFAGFAASRNHNSGLNSEFASELVQQKLRLFEVRQIEALAERAVDRRQYRARLAMHSLAAPKLGEARSGAQRERLLPARARQIERLAKARFRAV